MCVVTAQTPLMTEIVTSSVEEVAQVNTPSISLKPEVSESKDENASSTSLQTVDSNVESGNAAKTATLFDDIFDTDGESSVSLMEDTLSKNYKGLSHPASLFSGDLSDVPRLRSIHVTAGYRDGIADGKSQSVQAGFDEGYSLGAVIGLDVGWILGILEGLIVAMAAKEREQMRIWEEENTRQIFNSRVTTTACYLADLTIEDEGLRFSSKKPHGSYDESQSVLATGNMNADENSYVVSRLRVLQFEAEKSLSAANLFGSEFFGEDGIWLYDLPRASEDSNGLNIDGFEEVAAAHPRIKAWKKVALQWAERLEIDLNALEQINN